MRKPSAALVALVAAIALTALAAPAWAAKPKPKSKALVVSPTEVRAGQMVTVSGGCKSSGPLAFSIDSKEFHRGYTKRGNFTYDVKLPRGLEAGSHRLGAQCRGSKHTPARFTIKDKKRDWDEDCEEKGYGNEEGYGNEDEEHRYGENVGYEEDCEADEKSTGSGRGSTSAPMWSPPVTTSGPRAPAASGTRR